MWKHSQKPSPLPLEGCSDLLKERKKKEEEEEKEKALFAQWGKKSDGKEEEEGEKKIFLTGFSLWKGQR